MQRKAGINRESTVHHNEQTLVDQQGDQYSTPENRSGRAQMLDERPRKLDEREATIEHRLGELKDCEEKPATGFRGCVAHEEEEVSLA